MKEKIISLAKKNNLFAFLFINAEYYFRWCLGHRDNSIIDAIDHYGKCEGYPAKLVKDIMYCKYVEGFENYAEYFMFGFNSKKHKDRKDYVCSAEYRSHFTGLKNRITVNVFKDKYLAYELLKKYYLRECVKIDGFEDYAKFVDFVSRHDTFMVKELEGSLGQGISVVTINKDVNLKNAFFTLLQKSPCIIEELIKQSESMAEFNSHSVNTVRFAMFTHTDGRIEDVYAMFRTGIGNSIVDNASMGGIACAVDTQTGVVISNGYTKSGMDCYISHPESGIKYKGYQIPRWDELKQTIYEASKLAPEFQMIGWDMALTDNGWAVIEANSRPNINTIQMCLGHGLRDVLQRTVATQEK